MVFSARSRCVCRQQQSVYINGSQPLTTYNTIFSKCYSNEPDKTTQQSKKEQSSTITRNRTKKFQSLLDHQIDCYTKKKTSPIFTEFHHFTPVNKSVGAAILCQINKKKKNKKSEHLPNESRLLSRNSKKKKKRKKSASRKAV